MHVIKLSPSLLSLLALLDSVWGRGRKLKKGRSQLDNVYAIKLSSSSLSLLHVPTQSGRVSKLKEGDNLTTHMLLGCLLLELACLEPAWIQRKRLQCENSKSVFTLKLFSLDPSGLQAGKLYIYTYSIIMIIITILLLLLLLLLSAGPPGAFRRRGLSHQSSCPQPIAPCDLSSLNLVVHLTFWTHSRIPEVNLLFN